MIYGDDKEKRLDGLHTWMMKTRIGWITYVLDIGGMRMAVWIAQAVIKMD